LLVAYGVGGILADVLPLIVHPNIGDLDGGVGHVGRTGREADSALHGREGVVGLKLGVKHSNVDPFSVLRLVDPRDLWWRGTGSVVREQRQASFIMALVCNAAEHFKTSSIFV